MRRFHLDCMGGGRRGPALRAGTRLLRNSSAESVLSGSLTRSQLGSSSTRQKKVFSFSIERCGKCTFRSLQCIGPLMPFGNQSDEFLPRNADGGGQSTP